MALCCLESEGTNTSKDTNTRKREMKPSRHTTPAPLGTRDRTWEGVRAASLSIVAGVGHLYLGYTRGAIMFVIGMGLLLLSRTLWPQAELWYLSLAIFSAVDAYGIAKRGHGLL